MRHGCMYKRLLVYSHDTFGLGHLRRCRALAHAIVDALPEAHVHILSGSRDSLRFTFKERVHCTPLPGIRKTISGDYAPAEHAQTLHQTLALRRDIMLAIAKEYQPDALLVDKEPWGLSGELKPTLEYLHEKGVPLILGLRDILDAPRILAAEWERKNVWPALALYRALWVYGDALFYQPLAGVANAEPFLSKLDYVGYLRTPPPLDAPVPLPPFTLLVMDGGGGDGLPLMEWVVNTYRATPALPPALAVLGPHMETEGRQRLTALAANLPHLHLVDFLPAVEHALEQASGVVAMCGYNTFCELLSYRKPALVLPRTTPRLEQSLRAERAAARGYLRLLPTDAASQTPACLAEAIVALADFKPTLAQPAMMGALDVVPARLEAIWATKSR
jgi:predicted glycosyltransferase